MHDCISSVFAVCLYYNYHSVSTCMTVCIIFVYTVEPLLEDSPNKGHHINYLPTYKGHFLRHQE